MVFSSEMRSWLIELLLYWEGEVNAPKIASLTSVSRQQASTDIKAYMGQLPNNAVYCPRRKRHVIATEFKRVYISGKVSEYLNWIAGGQGQGGGMGHGVPWLSLPTLERNVAPAIIRGLVAAMRSGARLDVEYFSLNSSGNEGRVIVPHSFVQAGQRWHVRAYCEKNGRYSDFVLSRFRGEPELLGKSRQSSEQDELWQKIVPVRLCPDRRLNPAERAIIEFDYQMQDGELVVEVRACLVEYLLRSLHVSTKVADSNPKAQQLELVNWDDLKPYFFDR